ncbi:MAG: RagB/SusD family nutrient uptake outer membrane protein [Ginsengibacter sp.]
MKKIFLLLCMAAIGFSSCKKQLDIAPQGVLSPEQVATPDNIDNFVIAAYSELGNGDINVSFSLFEYGDVRSDDAYKGGRDEGDGQEFHFMETFTNTRPDLWPIDGLWYRIYVGISRTNTALGYLDNIDEGVYPMKTKRTAEMRFLRGFYYFMLKELFNHVPYIDETMPTEDYATVSNVGLSSDSLWEKIAGDFQFAADNLPATQPDAGRPVKAAAYGFLAKTKLYQGFKQDDSHNVTGVDAQKMQEAVNACDQAINSQFHLENDYGYNFLPEEYENGPESMFAIQFSRDDGTLYGRVNEGDALSVPQGLGCCDFHKPSQNFVNAFRVDANGLPLLDNFNDKDVDLSNDYVDPRLDHTVSIPDHNWKYEPAHIVKQSWSRNPGVYGYYNSMKENVSPDCDCFVPTPPFFPNSKNKIQMRFAEILLMKAEALIELGRQDEALPLINDVRARAAKSTALLKDANGNDEDKFKVGLYQPGVNITWDQGTARKALRFERRLELGQENQRFFDLVRWGIADVVLNNYFNTEKVKFPFLNSAHFTKNKNEYLPIPQNQINFSRGVYKQNIGY